MQHLISLIENQQIEYINKRSKSFLKESSQFFTPIHIADKMISTIDFERFFDYEEINILEPSAGFGILALAIVKEIIDKTNIININITLYELDNTIYKSLKKTLKIFQTFLEVNYKVSFNYKVYNSNFIIENSIAWNENSNIDLYDIIVSNPPFKKINQSYKEASIMKDIVHGQPNIYALFIGMSLKLLKENGVYVVISPRNYLSGEYSKKLRSFIFSSYSLTHMHSFDDRYIFRPVNQEVIISTYEKRLDADTVQISHNGSFSLETNLDDLIYDKEIFSLLIPKSKEDLNLISSFSELECSLSDLNIKVSVGPVVQFRNSKFLSKDLYSNKFAPLLISNDVQDNNFINYIERENVRKTHNKSINILSKRLIRNANYLILRKVTAKDDKNLLVSAVLDKNYFDYDLIGFDNNLLYFHRLSQDSTLSLEECYGLYCYINSKYFKQFYSLINGTHTINVSDFNKIPFPAIDKLIIMGKEVINSKNFSESNCSNIFKKIIKR